MDHNAKLLPGQVLSSGGKNIDEPAGRGVTKFMALDKPLDKPVPGRTFVDVKKNEKSLDLAHWLLTNYSTLRPTVY